MKKAVIFDLFGVLVLNGQPNNDLVSIAKELKGLGVKSFVLSNADNELAGEQIKTFPFLTEVFDKFYYSGQTGFIKPEEGAYKLILEENNLKPEECVYFDDSARYISVAESLGIESYLFEGPEQVREKLFN